jgi:hypothetical protein
MQTVTILRQLWRFRVLTAVIGVVAILAGGLVVYNPSSLQSRQYQVGVATARILVDTPDSQVVDVMPKGADALGVRANLLSNLMVDGVVKAQIAHRAGISPDSFYGIAESGSGPKPKVPSGRKVVMLKTRLLTQSDGTPLPIIEIEATAPDTARATALADGAVTGLQDYLNTKAAEQKVSDGSRLRVSGIGIAQAHARPVRRLGRGRRAARLLPRQRHLAGCRRARPRSARDAGSGRRRSSRVGRRRPRGRPAAGVRRRAGDGRLAGDHRRRRSSPLDCARARAARRRGR